MARIDDEFSTAAGGDVFAARPVAGFAAGLAGQRGIFKMHPRMRAGGESPDDFLMAIGAGLVADILCAGNLQRHQGGTRSGGTRNQKQSGQNSSHQRYHQ